MQSLLAIKLLILMMYLIEIELVFNILLLVGGDARNERNQSYDAFVSIHFIISHAIQLVNLVSIHLMRVLNFSLSRSVKV